MPLIGVWPSNLRRLFTECLFDQVRFRDITADNLLSLARVDSLRRSKESFLPLPQRPSGLQRLSRSEMKCLRRDWGDSVRSTRPGIHLGEVLQLASKRLAIRSGLNSSLLLSGFSAFHSG